MKQNSIRKRAKKVPLDIKLLVKKSMATARKINEILDKKGITQRDLANLLGKNESEISKWLQGTHNFTYMTICKIEAVLGEEIITTAVKETQIFVYSQILDSLKSAISECQFTSNKNTQYSEFEDNKLSFTSSNVGKLSIQNLYPELYSCHIN